MVLLRRLIGDVLRRHRLGQARTLRDVSAAAQVSLGYLSEVERGQKEPSSELLAAICDALHVSLAEVLREVSDELAGGERRAVLPIGFTAPTGAKTVAVKAGRSPAVATLVPSRTAPQPVRRSDARPATPVTMLAARPVAAA